MKTLLQLLATGLMIVSLSGCGGTSTNGTDKDNNSNNQDNGEQNNTTYLLGGPVDKPVELQFNKPYYVGKDYQKSYVKFTVDRFQRIVFEQQTNKNRYWNSLVRYNMITIYDKDMNVFRTWASGDAWKNIYGHTYGSSDIIFLIPGTYTAEYFFEGGTCSDCADMGIIIVKDLGKAKLAKVQNKGTYLAGNDGHKYFILSMKKDGDVNFKGDLNSYGDLTPFSAILYDYDLNIIENFNSVRDINVTLPQGDYLFHPTGGICTITFQNP